jgi:D-threonate/D-erythronate kinase
VDRGQAVRVAIVADDVTGATDAAVQFAHSGWATSIRLDADRPSERAARQRDDGDAADPAAVATIADTRALNAAPARAATAHQVTAALAEGADRLFLKIDSTMRGSVAAQMEGALASWRVKHPRAVAVVCPAYPAAGRIVTGGVLEVDGVPLAESEAARDAVTPVSSSDVPTLIPGSRRCARLDPDTLSAAAGGEVFVVDAATGADLEELARVTAARTAHVVVVGSAGLAGAMARHWHPRPHSARVEEAGTRVRTAQGLHIIQVSSVHERAVTQADMLESVEGDRIAACRFTVDDLRSHGAASAAALRVRAQLPRAEILLLRAPVERVAHAEATDAREMARAMAAATAQVVRSERPASLGLVGGDGARAALRALGVTTLSVHGSLAEGVPVGRAEDGAIAGVRLWTKAGGFGTSRTLLDLVHDGAGMSPTPRPHTTES